MKDQWYPSLLVRFKFFEFISKIFVTYLAHDEETLITLNSHFLVVKKQTKLIN